VPEHPDPSSDARKNSGTDEAFAQIGKCTGSNANFTLAKEWIETCREGHLTCNGHRPPVGPFPTRLVDVGTKSHDPHIYEVEIDKQIPEYITLSHCWGGLSMYFYFLKPLVLFGISFVLRDLTISHNSTFYLG
jgi:hypothetical protein